MYAKDNNSSIKFWKNSCQIKQKKKSTRNFKTINVQCSWKITTIIKRHAYQRKKRKKKTILPKNNGDQTSWPKWNMVYKISSDVVPNLAQFQLFKSVGVLRNEENWEIVFNNRLLIVFIQLVQKTFN